MPPRPTPKRAPSPPRGTNRVGGERKFRLEVRLNNEWWELERQKRGF